MVKITHIDYGPNYAFYSEGLKSYAPHWARKFQQQDLVAPKNADPQMGAKRKSVKVTKPTTSNK